MKMIRSIAVLGFALYAGQAVAASTCNVKEYKDIGYSIGKAALQIAAEPPVTDQTPVDFTAGEAKSAVFDSATRFIEVICTAQASYLVGVSPTATANNSWVPAGVSKVIGVPVGYRISFIAKP